MNIEQNEIELVKNMFRSLDALGYLGEFANLLAIITVLAGINSAGAITIPAVLLLLFNYWLLTKARMTVKYAHDMMKSADMLAVLQEKMPNINIQKIILKEGQNDTAQDNSHQD